MHSVSSLITRAIVVALLVSSATSCIIEGKGLEHPGVKMVNNTDLTLEIRYLGTQDWMSPEQVDHFQSLVELKPGEDYVANFPESDRHDDGCLDAAIVALGPDGIEMDRLPAGTCAPTPNGDINWEITRR